MSLVEVDHLSKVYPSFRLNEVSFTLEAGRIAGFIGRNGAGKTTTIKSMLNLVHPTGGSVRYFGMPLSGNEAEIKRRVGYSTGGVNYYPKKRLRDLAAVTKMFYPNWDESAYREYLGLFGLDERKSPSELSEGMKVKCSLAIALSHRAEVLILDEPTSGLDPFSRDELLEVFLMLKERGAAILFSTHITSDLEKCADDVIYIRGGSIVKASDAESFRRESGEAGETLEETILRMERSPRHD